MGTLRIYLTGRLLIEAGQGSIVDHTVSSHVERISLGFLVLNRRRPVAIGEIADAIWDNDRPEGWHEMTTTGLEQLKESLDALPEIGLEVSNDMATLALSPEVWVDIEHAHRSLERATTAMNEGKIDSAVTLSTSAAVIGKRPFLPGLESRWISSQRSIHTANLIEGLLLRSEGALRSGAADEAVRIARQALDHDPLNEPALRALMRSMDASGDRVGALRVYEEYRASVAKHPGAAPTEATQDLAAELRTPLTPDLDLLTPRQNEVASLLADGLTNRQISERLFISVQTAETHVKHILAKLGLSSRGQVAALVAAHRRDPSNG